MKNEGRSTQKVRMQNGGSGNPNPNPPPDRTKHGGYVPVFMDALDSDEQELLESIPEDTELQLMEQIQLFYD